MALVPKGFPGGTLHPGDILVSNFDGSSGKQGTGRTVVSVSPTGTIKFFFAAPRSVGPAGLTAALVALRSGVVVVGSMPTTDGTSKTVRPGGLFFIGRSGHVLSYLQDSTFLDGPWDMTANERNPSKPVLYISNVLNGVITRLNLDVKHGKPTVESMTSIGAFPWRPDPAALEVGPTGLALSSDGRSLYVADTDRNEIRVLHDPAAAKGGFGGSGRVVASGRPLEGPLGLTWAPNGDLIASNGDAAGPAHNKTNINEVVEVNPATGRFVAVRQLDISGTPGAIFGVAVARLHGGESLVYVDDNTNTLDARRAM